MTTPTWTYESSMAPHEDSPGGSTFEVLPLTPPRPNLKPGGAPPLSPRFSPPARVRTGRDLFSHSQPILPPSPLGSPARAHQSSLGGSRLSKTPTAPSSLAHSVAPPEREREYAREAFGRSSSFNENRNVASPRADEKPPIPIFSRVGSFRSASLTRSLSSKDASAPHTLDRLLSMEKGENWRWSQNEDGNRNDIWSRNASYNSELDDEVLENRGQLDGTWNVWRILKYGSPAIKKLLILIALTFSYSTTEFLFGLFTGRIGLVSDAFHLTFGCGVLTFSLFAMVYSKARPDERYTYGYNRLEVLSAFTNALFLLFLSFSLAVEALHAFVQDESEHKHYLIISAVANMIVNLLGVLFFRKYTRVRVVYRKAEDMNNHAICLHVLSDSIRSAGVVLASWFLALGVKYAETLCLGLVAVVVFLTTVPLFKASGGVLLQMAPTGISHSALSKCQRQVTLLEEVIECYKARFWDIAPGSVVGTLVIQIKAGTDEQKILKHVHSVYNDVGVKDLTVQLEIQQCCE